MKKWIHAATDDDSLTSEEMAFLDKVVPEYAKYHDLCYDLDAHKLAKSSDDPKLLTSLIGSHSSVMYENLCKNPAFPEDMKHFVDTKWKAIRSYILDIWKDLAKTSDDPDILRNIATSGFLEPVQLCLLNPNLDSETLNLKISESYYQYDEDVLREVLKNPDLSDKNRDKVEIKLGIKEEPKRVKVQEPMRTADGRFIDEYGHEYTLEDIYEWAADYVNDTDFDYEYDTPQKFSQAVVAYIEKEFNAKLNRKEISYINKQAKQIAFDDFADDY